MKMKTIKWILNITIIGSVFFVCRFSAHALMVDTHQNINERIATIPMNGFLLDDYLKTNLGFIQGIKETFNLKKVSDWVKDGGKFEDEPPLTLPYLRSVNHFHNPLTNNGYTGLWGTGTLSGQSAIQWSQLLPGLQSPGGYYSWFDVRDYYYHAITATTKTERETNFAETFRGLGQLMHLVQDMSVTDHTRNDGSHSIFYGYENWVKDQRRLNAGLYDSFFSNPLFYDVNLLSSSRSVFQGAPFSAPVPIANLFDSNLYNGTDPDITKTPTLVGLSEYSNANFFSPDTIFSSRFPYPALSSVAVYDELLPGTTEYRTYLKKVGDGDVINHLAAIGWFYKYLTLPFLPGLPTTIDPQYGFFLTDDQVYTDYASHLLPRAVGYSATLLNYFFRGQIALSAPDRYVYAIGAPGGSFGGSFNGDFKVKAQNITSTGETMSGGQIQLVVKYRLAGYDPITYPLVIPPPPTSPEDFFYIVVPEKNGINTIPQNSPVELTFDLSANPLPFWATDVYIQVVYQGQLGNESNAVAAGFKDISEPSPILFANDMDHICLFGGYYPAGSQQALGIAATIFPSGWDVYAHSMINTYLKFSSAQFPQWPTPSDHTATFMQIPPGNYGKVYILADYGPYAATTLTTIGVTDPNDTFTYHPQVYGGELMETVAYQTDFSQWPYYSITIPGVGLFRGVPYNQIDTTENPGYPNSSNCAPNLLFSAQPNLAGPAGVTFP